jgi:hypothetical protein
MPHQQIHESVFEFDSKEYSSSAYLPDGVVWDKDRLKELNMLEYDPYASARVALAGLDEAVQEQRELPPGDLGVLETLTSTGISSRYLSNTR